MAPPTQTSRKRALPPAIRALDFAQARADELLDVARSLEGEPRPKRPRLLRRRARSHAPNIWLAKFRTLRVARARRALLRHVTDERLDGEERIDRRHVPQRLPTHVWHAKRFHMRTLACGLQLPERACDRGARSALRAALRGGALLHDRSYEWVVEVRGSAPALRELLELTLIAEPPADLAAAQRGELALSGLLHWPGVHPAGLVGPACAVWRPGAAGREGMDDGPAGSATLDACVWVAVHAAAWGEAVGALRAGARACAGGDGGAPLGADGAPLVDERPVEVCCFDVLGIDGHGRLMQLLSDSGARETAGVGAQGGLLERATAARQPQSAVRARAVLSLEWPLPAPRGVAETRDGQGREEGAGSIWDAHVRRALARRRCAAASRRAPARPAAASGDSPRPRQCAPVLLIQLPAAAAAATSDPIRARPWLNRRARAALSGWRVLVPTALARDAWQQLVRARLRPVGVLELRALALESGAHAFPADFPEAAAAAAEAAADKAAGAARHRALPPRVRPNYAALRSAHPFGPDWAAVLSGGGGAGAPGGGDGRGGAAPPPLAAAKAENSAARRRRRRAEARAAREPALAPSAAAPAAHADTPGGTDGGSGGQTGGVGGGRSGGGEGNGHGGTPPVPPAHAPGVAVAAAEPAGLPAHLIPAEAPPVPAFIVVRTAAQLNALLAPAAAAALDGQPQPELPLFWQPIAPHCLCAVRVRYLGRGRPRAGSFVCAPSDADRAALLPEHARARAASHGASPWQDAALDARDGRSRALVGFLTSAGISELGGAGVGVGCASVQAVREMYARGLSLGAPKTPTPRAHTAAAGQPPGQPPPAPPPPLLALVRTPTSAAFRPVALQIIMCSSS